jgi:hypothetical protein
MHATSIIGAPLPVERAFAEAVTERDRFYLLASELLEAIALATGEPLSTDPTDESVATAKQALKWHSPVRKVVG